jgi:hypothetical protein
MLRSPYMYSKPFIATHNFMFVIHWPMVLLAFCASLFVWMPYSRKLLEDGPRALAQLLAALLLYNTAILMVLAPYVRYSIPFLPLQYAMAALFLFLIGRWLRGTALSPQSH